MKPRQFAYSAYGLRLISDRLLPGLIPLDSDEKPPDLCIQFGGPESKGDEGDPAGQTLWYTTDIPDAAGNPALKIWRGSGSGDFFVRYSHGLIFRVNAAVSCIYVHHIQSINEAEVAAFLLGPVLGIVLRLRGVTCLHASAIEIDGKAVAFAGIEGAGKSTSAAIFAHNGHAVLTDDIVALEKDSSRFKVHPGHPFLNLLPESMGMLSATGKMPPSPEMEKQQVLLGRGKLRFREKALPLGAVYLLGERTGEATTIHSLSPQEALIGLASNTFANKMLDVGMRVEEFRTLGALVKSVSVRRLMAPVRSACTVGFYCDVCEDARSAMKSRAG